MSFEKFISEIPAETKELILNAIKIYKELENKKLECKIYHIGEEGSPQFLSKTDKRCGALFLSSLFTDGDVKKIMEDSDITFKKALQYFGLSNIKIKDCSFLEYTQYYENDFKLLIGLLKESYDYDINNSTCFPERLISHLAYEHVCGSRIVDSIFKYLKESRSFLGAYESISFKQINESLKQKLEGKGVKNKLKNDSIDDSGSFGSIFGGRQNHSEESNFLSKYGEYLTDKNYLTNPAIGREEEIRSLMLTLLTPDKSAVLTGNPGVGKTAVAEGLAYLIINDKAPKMFKNVKIIKINTSALVKGCSFVGMFEERVEKLIRELLEHKDTILYIDELHTAIGAGTGSKSNLDLANILKPYLDRGQIKVIGATTDIEYDTYIKKDGAFKRRFERIKIPEPKQEIVFKILSGTVQKIEDITKIKFEFDEVDKQIIFNHIIESTDEKCRVYDDIIYNPDLALSVLKKAFAIAALEESDNVRVEDVSNAIMICDRLNEEVRKKYANLLTQNFKNKAFKRELVQ